MPPIHLALILLQAKATVLGVALIATSSLILCSLWSKTPPKSVLKPTSFSASQRKVQLQPHGPPCSRLHNSLRPPLFPPSLPHPIPVCQLPWISHILPPCPLLFNLIHLIPPKAPSQPPAPFLALSEPGSFFSSSLSLLLLLLSSHLHRSSFFLLYTSIIF